MPHLLAGPKATAELSKTIGLPIRSLCGLGGTNVRLGLRNGKLKLTFHLLAKGAPNAVLETPGLALAAEGECSPAMKRLIEAIAARLGARTLDDVLGIIAADPDTFTEMVPDGGSTSALRVPIAAGPINLLEAGWRNFFADQDYEVLLGYPELKMNKTIYARYSDRECLYSWSGNDPRKWSFFAYPVRVPSDSFGATVFRTGIVMELEERDMVLGAVEKADALVESVAKASPGSGADYVVFNHFCASMVMGEDSGSITRRIEEASGLKTVCWSHGDRDQLNNFGEHFKELFARPGYWDAPPVRNAVNLFHFPTDYREAELVPLLAEMGVESNTRLFPDVEFPSMERIPRAAVHVFGAATSYQSRLPELLAGGARPVLTVRAPYGIEDAGECLKAIARAAGREKAFEAVWKEKLAALKPEWEDLTARAKTHRLAFVVSETTLPRLWELRHGQGAPMMRMIEEMGFGVDLLYYDPHDDAPEVPGDSRCARLATFRTPDELTRLLREGEFRAVYSDIFFDWRISGAGKARFSSKDFEMGLEGAVRSLRRLLALCRLPFYHRYGPHLAGLAGRTLA
ncbi:MAG: hypothetical protein A2X37_05245 [Elusimicrobia bacterium GWA2_66_18]|nr:MAG: hypothetical protein A2X37_05245 [Elusimicrobia bacterium GWA2_66_18]